MSGHSKWATIKRKKAVTDARRGKLFTQLIKEITIAARAGGGDPTGNPRLRLAIDKARAGNMPADNIKRAVMRGTGELPGVTYEDVSYEAYGPGGVALIIETVSDNKNRTVSEIRHILDRNSGKLAATGAVAYQFHRKGIITVPVSSIKEDDLMVLILDAGAEDLKSDEELHTVTCAPDSFENVRKVLEEKGVTIEHAELQMIPESTIKVEGKDAETVLKLIESLEDHDDVQHVHANFEMDDQVMANYQGN